MWVAGGCSGSSEDREGESRNLSNVGREQKYCKRGLQALEEYLGACNKQKCQEI